MKASGVTPAPEKPKPSTYYLPSFDPDSFVGRTENLVTLRNAFVPNAGRFLLSGEPGIGKSTLALKFAWDAQNDFQAVLFQPCGRRSVEAIIGEMADTLKAHLGEDVSQAPPEQKLRAVKEWLKQQRSLLVLDDIWLESDTDASAMSSLRIRDLVPDPSVSVLITSRRPNLPFVAANRRLPLDAFLPEEVEEVFRRYLGEETLERHRGALMDFAGKVERLPIAVIVGAQLLQSEFGPLDEAARGIALSKLRNEVNDVPGLLRRATETQGQDEQRLLMAASVCVPEGFWLPLVLQIAGLDQTAGEKARNNLANASLLRVLDQDAQKFQLHLLVRDQARSMATVTLLEELQQAHARALEELFAEREDRWRDCALCLAEVVPAVAFLRSKDEMQRARKLIYNGFATAYGIGDLEAALQTAQRDEEYWQAVAGDLSKDGLQVSYGHQALVLRIWGKLEEAMALLKKGVAICLELGNKRDLQAGYTNQALILKDWGKLEEAMALHKKQEAICLELGDKGSLQASYGNQALILHDWGKLGEAMVLHKKEEAICLELGDKTSLQRSYGNQGRILLTSRKLEEAMALLKRQEAICLELGNKDSLQLSYGNQALILRAWGKVEEAMALHKKEEAICVELGDKNDLQRSYGNQAIILQARGKLEEAMALLKKKEAICFELGNKASLGYCYWNWGVLACEQQQPELARQKLEQALALFTELKMPRERDAVEALLKQESNS